MVEARSGSGEAGGGWGYRSVAGERFQFQGLLQHPLDAADVDEIDRQGTLTGCGQSRGAVALTQSQQVLALPELGPRELAGQESLGELPDAGTQVGSLTDYVLRSTQGVGGALWRVVGRVGGAAAPGFLWGIIPLTNVRSASIL